MVDVDPRTLNIDYKKIEEKINDKTKGIVIAHTLGIPFDLQKIKDICDKYNLFLMEDNCDAFGSKFNNTPSNGARIVRSSRSSSLD